MGFRIIENHLDTIPLGTPLVFHFVRTDFQVVRQHAGLEAVKRSMCRYVAGMEEDAGTVAGIKRRRICFRLLFVPLIRTIKKLDGDEGLAVAGEYPSTLLGLNQISSLEAHAELPGVVGAECAASEARDALDEQDEPAAVVFFARPDVLSGLFTLANFDALDPAVIAPFASGCASIVYHAFQEREAQRPRAILGMFDVSARPCVAADELTLSVPWIKFVRMVENVPESFLITPAWQKVQARLERG